ncbi:TIGR03746 family integrating conjugative element protein [Vibrio fluvialis]|nr:TIGR03746 family integrating conjugative element protein [Vibrio fluvialis]
MSRAKRELDRKDKLIRVLTIFSLCLIGLLFYAQFRMSDLAKQLVGEFQCFVPPDLSRGGLIKVNEYPNQTVYAFAREIFQQTMRCESDCAEEYPKKVAMFRNYYTEPYWHELKQKAEAEKGRNRGRVRYVQEVGFFSDDKVTRLGNDTFKVELTVNEVEYIGVKKVRDAKVIYPFIVGAVNIDYQKNPWKLQIGGTESEPTRIK